MKYFCIVSMKTIKGRKIMFCTVTVVWRLKALERHHTWYYPSARKSPKLLTTTPLFHNLISKHLNLIGRNKSNAFIMFAENQNPKSFYFCIVSMKTIKGRKIMFCTVTVVWRLKALERHHTWYYPSARKSPKLLTTTPLFHNLISKHLNLIGRNKSNAFIMFAENQNPKSFYL